MTFSKHLFLGIAVISMSACQTMPSANLANPNDILLSDIASSSIGSSALAGTANQVTYQMGGKAYDSIMKKDPTAVPTIPASQQLADIENAAKLIGCPAPDANALAPVQAAVQP